MDSAGETQLETLRDNSRVEIRPISTADAELERAFIEHLSPQSRRFRFLDTMKTPDDALLASLTEVDWQHDAAYIALTVDSKPQVEVGVARFSADINGNAEIAVAVSDEWVHRGLATLLMRRVIAAARQHGIHTLYSIDARENHEMMDLAEHLGFTSEADPDNGTQVVYSLKLS